MSSILIEHADYVVTVDPERRMIRDGAVAIVDDRIAAVGKTDAVKPGYADAEVIDARGKLVLPGLFDTHIHGAQQLGRGLGDNMYQRFFTHLWKIESEMDDGDALCAFRLCQLELIRAGITCFADPGNYFPAIEAQAMKESGLRGIIRAPRRVNARDAGKVLRDDAQALARAKNSWPSQNSLTAGERVALDEHGAALLRRSPARHGRGCEQAGAGIMAPRARPRATSRRHEVRQGDVRGGEVGVLGRHVDPAIAWLAWTDPFGEERDVKSRSHRVIVHQAMGNSPRQAPEMAGSLATVAGSVRVSGNFLRDRQAYLGSAGTWRRDGSEDRHARSGRRMMTIDGASTTLGSASGSIEPGKKRRHVLA